MGWRSFFGLVSVAGRGQTNTALPEKNELANSCFFTYTLNFHLCDAEHAARGECNTDFGLKAADYQRKLINYYWAGEIPQRHANSTVQAPPPLEEAYWIVGLPDNFQDRMLKECPGLLLHSYILVAESKLFVHEESHGHAFFAKAITLEKGLPAEARGLLMENWPIAAAVDSYQNNFVALKQRKPMSAEMVICRCRENMTWIQDLSFIGPQVSISVYEKCNERTDPGPLYAAGFANVEVIDLPDPEGFRQDECVAYLAHVLDRYQSLPDVTFFFQADADEHMRLSYLELVLRSIAQGTYSVPFLHLNTPRLVTMVSRCKRAAYYEVFGELPGELMSTYCCAQFAVERERIISRPRELYAKMMHMLSAPTPEECSDIPGHSTYCLMYETLWHILFGEKPFMPLREENPRLPAFLRVIDKEQESPLPKGSMYLEQVQNEPEWG
jgi:hypothetical protein